MSASRVRVKVKVIMSACRVRGESYNVGLR